VEISWWRNKAKGGTHHHHHGQCVEVFEDHIKMNEKHTTTKLNITTNKQTNKQTIPLYVQTTTNRSWLKKIESSTNLFWGVTK
jgi:hypothetical protein